MEQMSRAEIHRELCNKMQSAKDAYCRNEYTAPEVDIDRLIKYKRKQTVKKVSRIAAVFLIFIITSVFFAQEFFSDNGYGKYIVQKSVSSMSPLDVKTERINNGELLSIVYIDNEIQLDEFNKFMGRKLVLGYMPEEYEFKCCNGHKANDYFTVLYQYEAGDLYMDIDVEDIDYDGKVYINGELVKTLDNGDKIYGENPDKGTYTVTRIINDDIFVVIDGDGSYEDAMRVAENLSVE